MRSVRRWHVQPGVHAFALLVGVLLGRNAPTMVEPLSRGSDRAWNFAFGSNMVPSTRQRRRLEPSRTVPAVVQGWELHFSLPGIPYIEPAFAALRPSNVSTHGVCLELDKENWLRLLVSEGVFRPDEANAMKRASLQEVLELAAKPTATFGYRLLPLQAMLALVPTRRIEVTPCYLYISSAPHRLGERASLHLSFRPFGLFGP